jgi:hypothetical protein
MTTPLPSPAGRPHVRPRRVLHRMASLGVAAGPLRIALLHPEVARRIAASR